MAKQALRTEGSAADVIMRAQASSTCRSTAEAATWAELTAVVVVVGSDEEEARSSRGAMRLATAKSASRCRCLHTQHSK